MSKADIGFGRMGTEFEKSRTFLAALYVCDNFRVPHRAQSLVFTEDESV